MKSDPRDYKIDIAGLTPPVEPSGSSSSSAGAPGAAGRAYLSVQFNCCRVYQRVYRSDDGRSYAGRCPKCARPVRFVVGPGGTAGRAFVVE